MTTNLAPAVRPNAGVAAAYRRELQVLIRDMAQSMLYHVRAAYRQAEPSHGLAVAQDASIFTLRLSLNKWGKLWQKKIDKLSLSLAKKFASKAFAATDASLRRSFADAGLTVKFKPTDTTKQAYQAVIAENVQLIKSIPQQYLKDVQTSVWQSVMRGADLAELTSTIKSKYGVAQRRAEFLATDQNAKAKSTLENARRQEMGITEAVWIHSSAGKTPRPTHVAMSGKRYKLSEGMYDSAIKKNTWPGVEPRCRCVSKAVIPGFE